MNRFPPAIRHPGQAASLETLPEGNAQVQNINQKDWLESMSEMKLPAFGRWRKGYGPIQHGTEAVDRIAVLAASGRLDADTLYGLLDDASKADNS